MDLQKTLAQLGDEYENAAGIITARIKEERTKFASLENKRLGKEAYRIKNELNTLYSERSDALETARKLRNYYSGAERRKPA